MSNFLPSIVSGHIKAPKLWLIDMDDTLYSASAGMFHEIDSRMTRFIQEEMGLEEKPANDLRMLYWKKYGVTYYGLWKHHEIDPHRFLTVTHAIDTSSVKNAGDERHALMRLPGRKALFTNAPICFAEQIIRRLHLEDVFDMQFRAEEMRVLGQWRPKPSAQMFRALLAREGLMPHEVCVVDDHFNNLKVAKRVGLQTVLCKGWRHPKLLATVHRPYIDAQIAHIRELPRLITRPAKKTARTQHHRPAFLNPYS